MNLTSTGSEALFLLCCSGLNFLDLMVRQGTIENPPKPPLVPGFECSGIVESVGENTKGFEVSEVTGVTKPLSVSSESVNEKYIQVKPQSLQVTSSLVSQDCSHISVCWLSLHPNMSPADRRQSDGFRELQRLGRGGLHARGFCLQDAG